jgi:hypothetical protein
MRIEEKEKKGIVLEIEEDVRIPGTNIILEKGDKIEVFESKKKESDDEDDEKEDPEDDEDDEKEDPEDDEDDDDEKEVEEKKKKGK